MGASQHRITSRIAAIAREDYSHIKVVGGNIPPGTV